MHLVVLRRNNIDLPDVLPAALVPQIGKQISDGTFIAFFHTVHSDLWDVMLQ